MTRGLSLFVRDNLEAFAVAIALALVVRHYSLEAFRIPSKSMMPTLIGADQGGDRILVDKVRWLFGEPHRWEPTVFQYPLNRSKNFIKRLVGLPGEWLRIRDGDVWTSRDGRETWQIQRKVGFPHAYESLLFPFYPAPVEEPDFFEDLECWECGPGWRAAGLDGPFDVDGTGALRFRMQVVPYQSEGIWGGLEVPDDDARGREAAGDLRVRFDLHVERAGTLTVVLTEHGMAHRLVLGPDGSRAALERAEGDERIPLDLRLVPGDYSISFANVDDTLVIGIDGEEELERTIEFAPIEAPDTTKLYEEARRIESEGNLEEASRLRDRAAAMRAKLAAGRYRVVFEAEDLKATLEDIRIERDVQYGEYATRAEIPANNYFMLGDNTASSKDSRAWEIAEVYLKDGTVIRWEEGHDLQRGDIPGQPDADFNIDGPDRVIEVKADIDGLVRRFHTSDVVRKETNVPWGFVPRENLVGRAFAIFWPIHIWPVVKGPTRVDLIR